MEAASAERLASRARRWHSSIKLVDTMKPSLAKWHPGMAVSDERACWFKVPAAIQD